MEFFKKLNRAKQVVKDAIKDNSRTIGEVAPENMAQFHNAVGRENIPGVLPADLTQEDYFIWNKLEAHNTTRLMPEDLVEYNEQIKRSAPGLTSRFLFAAYINQKGESLIAESNKLYGSS